MGYTAVAAAGLTYGIIQGERSAGVQREGLRRQKDAQQQAENAAISQQRKAEEEIRRTNRKKPNIAALLEAGRLEGQTGLGSTFLSGARGVPQESLLGDNSPLGG